MSTPPLGIFNLRAWPSTDFELHGDIEQLATKYGRAVHVESPLTHHLFYISIRKLVTAIPTDAQKNNGWLEVTPFERGFVMLQECNSRRVMFELEGGLELRGNSCN